RSVHGPRTYLPNSPMAGRTHQARPSRQDGRNWSTKTEPVQIHSKAGMPEAIILIGQSHGSDQPPVAESAESAATLSASSPATGPASVRQRSRTRMMPLSRKTAAVPTRRARSRVSMRCRRRVGVHQLLKPVIPADPFGEAAAHDVLEVAALQPRQ